MPANAATRAHKKPRRPRPARDEQTSAATVLASVRASLTSLPIEILAEILFYTCSPLTVLAVSRTCSFLYRSLAQNPAASFVWRGVRQTCKPVPLPDPGQCWKGSEADYAAFVFGGGVCEVCRKPTRAMYASFAARIRLCGSWFCRRRMINERLIDATSMYTGRDRQSIWVPYVESNLCFYPPVFEHHASGWPESDTVLFRKTDLERFQLELAAYQDAEQARERAAEPGTSQATVQEADEQRERVMKRCHAEIQRFPEIMKLSAALTRWKYAHDQVYKVVKKQNKSWTKDLAEREGWDLDDLVASQAYGSLQSRKNLLVEPIGQNDVSPIWSAIESELLAVQVHHKRKKSETAYREKLAEVKKIYERIRCRTVDGAHTVVASPGDPIDGLALPPFSVFCTLPSVRALKGSPDPSAVPPSNAPAGTDIKSSSLATTLVISDLHTWLAPVQKHLTTLLGHPNGWQSASSRMLHPLRRVTARFFCRQCGEGEVGKKYWREQCLDLKGVCSHVCVRRKGIQGRQEGPRESETEGATTWDGDGQEAGVSRGKKKSGVKTLDWKVDVFEKDEKAIRLIRTILELRGLSEEDPSTASTLNAKGGVIRCMTCKGWVLMDFETAIGHAHRHESMQIRLLDVSAPKDDWFMRTGLVVVPHIIPKSQLPFSRGTVELFLGPLRRAPSLCKKVDYGCRHCLVVVPEDKIDDIGKPEIRKGARAMDFHGLRSHVKEKHGIQDIRDEDFFCYSSI